MQRNRKHDIQEPELQPVASFGAGSFFSMQYPGFNGFVRADRKPLKRLKALSVDPATGLKPRC
jgi:hypothetical protein